jgi:hypothetical protein
MTFRLTDNTRETTTTTGTGPFTLGGAVAGSQAFATAGFVVGDTFWGTIRLAASSWVTGLMTYSNTNEVTVTTVLEGSSGAGVAVSFGAGTKDVFVDLPASKAASLFDTITGAKQGGFSTGDVKWTWKTTADTGWIMVNDGTIGDASSAGSTRANADTSALYTLIWNNFANAEAAVSTGRGANAAADFAAHKTIALPKALGRAIAVSGAGSGLTSRVIGKTVGEESHTQTTGELVAHTHPVPRSNTGCGATIGLVTGGSVGTGATDNSTGGGGAFNVMQPTSFWNVMVKL